MTSRATASRSLLCVATKTPIAPRCAAGALEGLKRGLEQPRAVGVAAELELIRARHAAAKAALRQMQRGLLPARVWFGRIETARAEEHVPRIRGGQREYRYAIERAA